LKREGRTRVVRVGAAIAASLVLVAGWYALNTHAATRYHREIQETRQQLSRLEPEAQRLDALRQAQGIATARTAALSAFQSQGPRLARLLEALSSSTPDDIVITSVTVQSDTTRWRATVNGIAVTEDAASGQASVNALLQELSTSPYVGAPVQPPSLRIVSGTAATTGVSNPAGGSPALPDGMSGVEFVVSFVLTK
jgi:Tfp pilus assembly protein PilN